jgi:cysteine-rich repeat protein
MPCGNGIIDPGEECDDMNSPADEFCEACQITCTTGKEHPTTHHCYAHSGGATLSWANGQNICKSAGAHLATITTQAELDWLLTNLPPPTDSFLGGSDMAARGTFAWINGEPWTWPMSGAPWDLGEPNGSGDCLHIEGQPNDFGNFDDADCNTAQAFYCEREPAGMKP